MSIKAYIEEEKRKKGFYILLRDKLRYFGLKVKDIETIIKFLKEYEKENKED